MHKYEDGIGVKIAKFIQEVVAVIAALVISISINWKLTLAISAFVPFLLIIVFIMTKV